MVTLAPDTHAAQQRWELENEMETDDTDRVYMFDADYQQKQLQTHPWLKDPHYFKTCRISALALLKMVMHARSGGDLEVMGIMQGKIDGDKMYVMDAFAVPVEGTETRVNAQAEAYEYMVEYLTLVNQVGRLENAIGWYHSHPGYGCWLSGIDVSTQMLNQQHQDPFVAVVIDPTRTVAAGKVDLGAFRTYPEDYKPPNEPESEYQSIPLNKIEDFGVHAKKYYSMEVEYFKSKVDQSMFDLLWHKYWVNTLSSTPVLRDRDYLDGQVRDLAEKMENAESVMSRVSYSRPVRDATQVPQIARDSSKMTIEQVHGLVDQILKHRVFNQARADEMDTK